MGTMNTTPRISPLREMLCAIGAMGTLFVWMLLAIVSPFPLWNRATVYGFSMKQYCIAISVFVLAGLVASFCKSRDKEALMDHQTRTTKQTPVPGTGRDAPVRRFLMDLLQACFRGQYSTSGKWKLS